MSRITTSDEDHNGHQPVDEFGRLPMIVLGLLLILVAVGATAVAVTAPMTAPQVVKMTALGISVSASPRAMFLAGGVSLLLFVFGLVLINGGTRRRARARKELRGLRKDQAAAPADASADEGGGSSRRNGSDDGAGTGSTDSGSTDSGSTDSGAQLRPERNPDSERPLRPD
jgi:hypothetical protein